MARSAAAPRLLVSDTARFKVGRLPSLPPSTATNGKPRQFCPRGGTAADPPGSWLLASGSRGPLSRRDGAPGGRPGPGHRAAGSGPGASAKPSAEPRDPQPGPGSTEPRGGCTGNIGTRAGKAGGPSGSVGGAAWRQRRGKHGSEAGRPFLSREAAHWWRLNNLSHATLHGHISHEETGEPVARAERVAGARTHLLRGRANTYFPGQKGGHRSPPRGAGALTPGPQPRRAAAG